MKCRRCGSEVPQHLLGREAFRCPTCGNQYRRRPQNQRPQKGSGARDGQNSRHKNHVALKGKVKAIVNKKIWIWPLWLWVSVLFLALIIFLPSPKEQTQQDAGTIPSETTLKVDVTATPIPTSAAVPTDVPKYSTTGTTVADFINRFEAGMYRFGVPCKIVDQGVDENGYGVLAVDNLLAMNYTIADGEISDLFLFASGNGTTESGARVLYAIASAMYGIDPSTVETETGKVIMDMLDGTTYQGANYVMSGSTNSVTGTTVVFSGTMR